MLLNQQIGFFPFLSSDTRSLSPEFSEVELNHEPQASSFRYDAVRAASQPQAVGGYGLPSDAKKAKRSI